MHEAAEGRACIDCIAENRACRHSAQSFVIYRMYVDNAAFRSKSDGYFCFISPTSDHKCIPLVDAQKMTYKNKLQFWYSLQKCQQREPHLLETKLNRMNDGIQCLFCRCKIINHRACLQCFMQLQTAAYKLLFITVYISMGVAKLVSRHSQFHVGRPTSQDQVGFSK